MRRKHSLWPTAHLQWQRALLADEPASRCFGLRPLVAPAVSYLSMYTATDAEPDEWRQVLSSNVWRYTTHTWWRINSKKQVLCFWWTIIHYVKRSLVMRRVAFLSNSSRRSTRSVWFVIISRWPFSKHTVSFSMDTCVLFYHNHNSMFSFDFMWCEFIIAFDCRLIAFISMRVD